MNRGRRTYRRGHEPRTSRDTSRRMCPVIAEYRIDTGEFTPGTNRRESGFPYYLRENRL